MITTKADDERRARGIGRNAHTSCAADGCELAPTGGHAMFRVNPKGELGIFMCRQHAEALGLA